MANKIPVSVVAAKVQAGATNKATIVGAVVTLFVGMIAAFVSLSTNRNISPGISPPPQQTASVLQPVPTVEPVSLEKDELNRTIGYYTAQGNNIKRELIEARNSLKPKNQRTRRLLTQYYEEFERLQDRHLELLRNGSQFEAAQVRTDIARFLKIANKVLPKSASGLMQLMPATARRSGPPKPLARTTYVNGDVRVDYQHGFKIVFAIPRPVDKASGRSIRAISVSEGLSRDFRKYEFTDGSKVETYQLLDRPTRILRIKSDFPTMPDEEAAELADSLFGNIAGDQKSTSPAGKDPP